MTKFIFSTTIPNLKTQNSFKYGYVAIQWLDASELNMITDRSFERDGSFLKSAATTIQKKKRKQ